MTKADFIKLMDYPEAWLSDGMYPDELFRAQLALYKPGDEKGAEHDRNGAFHWWLRRNPTKAELTKLLQLASLDPDVHMARDAVSYMVKAPAFDAELTEKAAALFPT